MGNRVDDDVPPQLGDREVGQARWDGPDHFARRHPLRQAMPEMPMLPAITNSTGQPRCNHRKISKIAGAPDQAAGATRKLIEG